VSGPEPARASSDWETFLNVSLHAGVDVRVRCTAYPDRLPILVVSSTPVSLMVTVPADAVGGAALGFARDFAAAAAAFLAECERLAAAPPASAEREQASTAEAA
jgi:hypothetical protein